ncbi:YjgN family protein [Thalassolituus hydrocarboniclasticus]|uniref:DUF898 domain-containing protein n=1 Tax=Thalassolituus hydrocarboniclasticus TaxID=2742796 RepID=A0ABY6AE95_9GAMM|nr:YjgN family protein [Thalassolituus hydrocarboniclasticus]UXD88784.1 DUF898 domain-containing protein [Thalassolituus hydrocarboniclasticus]
MNPSVSPDVSNAGETRTLPVVFSGKKGEYLKLWLVNMLLSILTLGIYSAWAKVRNTQYLYGHTQVEGHRLQYLATPLQILRGRIIAVILFGLYVLLSSMHPVANLVLMLLLLAAMPWLLIQGLRFSLRMTAYRNVRFSFNANYGGVLLHFILLPILGALTFGLAMPWVIQRLQKYVHESISFGGHNFSLNSSAGYYYKAVFACIGLAILYFIALAILGSGVFAALAAENPAAIGGMIIIMISYFMFGYVIAAVYQSMIRNHVMNNLSIDGVVSFNSSVVAMPYVWLMLSNALLLIFTLGLAYPVTQIRKNKFLADATLVNLQPAADHLVNTVSDQDSAFGEEAAGLFDADLSLT